MKKKLFYAAMIGFFALSAISHYAGLAMLWQFIFACIAVILTAAFLGHATENVAHYAGQRLGGFLNATFGNAAELIIAIVLVLNAVPDSLGNYNHEVVKASLTGSIIGNMLLVLGLSVLLGGLKYKVQKFNTMLAGHNASLMLLSVIALFIPAAFLADFSKQQMEVVSMIVAGIMLLSYILWLLFSMVTHKSELSDEHVQAEIEEKPEWSKSLSIIFLIVATVMVAFVSEWLVGSLHVVTEQFDLSELFVGAFLIAIVGNAAEHSAAIFLALKNKIGAAVEIAVGSSLQIALLVAPLLVFISFFAGKPMDIVFTPQELVAIGASAFIAKSISRDGMTNWYEGVLLLSVYIILGVVFFMV